MRFHLEVRAWRGPILESRHRVQAAVCAADGRLEAGTERADLVTTFRSSAKPFQLLPLVERGYADRWSLSDEHLAIMAASHTGSAYHVGLVREILGRLGLTERHLACGFHEPLDAASAAALQADPGARTALYNNCSGKHAGMLALALAEDWPVAGYQRAEHPLQQLMRRTVAEVCGLAPERLAVATDGCSASVFGLPLASMARAYASLAAAEPGGSPRERVLYRIRSAMAAYPMAVGGEGRFSTLLMQRTGGRMIAKGGAEGLECVALPARKLGLAIKCEDGHARAQAPATLALLELLGELSADELAGLGDARRPVVKNHAGLEVGLLEAVVEVLGPSN